MAIPKSDKIVRDIMKVDGMWRHYVRAEDDSRKVWAENWGWIMEEYRCLQKKLQENSDKSEFLTRVLEEKKEDPRKLINFPETTNHEYGWVASQKEFKLEKYGPDLVKEHPLPDLYKICKH